ncbi:MAG: metalloregulator ArsR/SmtB family transcription factor [Candidatus Hodarchaeota archaeon]
MESLTSSTEVLKALADKFRLAIISSLQGGPLTAGEIEKVVGKSQSATSQQLKKLVDANILTYKQDGTKRIFNVKDPQVFDLIQSINSYISVLEAREINQGNIEDSRILFVGLDKSGKTSIMLSLLGNKNLLSYYSLPPTLGHKHMKEILNQLNLPLSGEGNAIYWEAGGQKVYRTDYLKEPKKFFNGFDNIFFVIDVQDTKRYEEALDYLEAVLGKLKALKVANDLTIFLHKYDPGIEQLDDYSDNKLNINIINKISAMIPPEYNYQIFKTSIFTVFRKDLAMQSFRA